MLAAIVLALWVPAVAAQSLGEVARKEQERRKSVKPGRIYTNEDLRPSTPVSPAAPPAAPAPGTDDQAATAAPSAQPRPPAAPADAQKKDEAYWKGRLQAEREALDRARVMLDALQSRVNGLQADFVNRDDPASRALIANERQRALQEIDRITLEVASRTKAVAGIQEEARRAGVPAAWYR